MYLIMRLMLFVLLFVYDNHLCKQKYFKKIESFPMCELQYMFAVDLFPVFCFLFEHDVSRDGGGKGGGGG